MNNDFDQPHERNPFRFSMRTLLLVMTGACVAGAVLARNLDVQLQIMIWGGAFFQILLVVFALFMTQKAYHRWATSPRETITIEVDAKWIPRIRSRWFMVVATLTGVSVSFAPFCLLWCGSGFREYGIVEWILVPLSFLTIYFVPGFYMQLAGEVIHQLMKHGTSGKEANEKSADGCGSQQRPY